MTTKADQRAADRILTAAVRRAVTMLRDDAENRDLVETLLATAGFAAGLLLDGAA